MRRTSPYKLVELLIDYFSGVEPGDWTPEEQAFALLRSFPSTTLHIPNEAKIEQVARQRHIVHRINRDPSTQNVRNLGDWHGMSLRDVVKGYAGLTGESVAKRRLNGSSHPSVLLSVPSRRHRFRPVGIFRGPQRIRDCVGQMMLFE